MIFGSHRVAALAVLLGLRIGFSLEAAEVRSFRVGDRGWHLGALAVGNIDSDPALEIVVPFRNSGGLWFLDAFNPDGTRCAGFPYASQQEEINVSPTLYDLDGDGRAEIFFTRGSSVIALRGNGSVLWSNSVNAGNYVPQAGYQSTTNGFYWSATGSFIPRLPSNAVFSSQVSSPIIADFNGDGVKEVATAWKIDPDPTGGQQDYNAAINDIFGLGEWGLVGESWSGGVVFHNAQTGQQGLVYHIHQLVEAGLGVGQVDDDAALEVFVLNDSDSVVGFDKTKPHGFHGNGMLHKAFGKNLRMTTGSYQVGIDVHTADIDGDGLDEILSPTTQVNPLWQPHETILDDDGQLLWRHWKQPVQIDNVNGWFNNATMIPCNPDHDNRLDVLSFTHSHHIWFREWNGVQLVDRAGWPKSFAPRVPTPPVVGDLDGDGDEEIVIGTYHPGHANSSGELIVFALNGEEEHRVQINGGIKHIPSIADLDGDGVAEVIVYTLDGWVRIFTFGNRAGGTISWPTHRGSARRDGRFANSAYPARTPLVVKREGGYAKSMFEWRSSNAPSMFRIYRASGPDENFEHISTVTGTTVRFTDSGLKPGNLYVYEIAAVYSDDVVRSAPFSILPLVNSNLVVNSGFEADDDSHWDKWDTGAVPWAQMTGTTNDAFRGEKALKIELNNQTTTDTVNQFVQYGTPDAYMPAVPGTLYSFGGFIRSGGMNASTEHWFEWTSTITGENRTPRPTLPYPNYFTPSVNFGSAASRWIYLNRVFVLPAGFPNLELRHRMRADSPVTGTVYLDDVFLRALPPLASSQWRNLIPFGDAWKYRTTAPPTAWTAADFDDSQWQMGAAKFGAGSRTINVRTPLPIDRPAYFFRKRFVVRQPFIEDFLLAATCTDDYGGRRYPLRVFLNGTELVSSGIEAVSGDGNPVKCFDLSPFIPMLKTGTNVIAVQLSNAFEPGWDDVAFDLSLRVIEALPRPHYIGSIRRESSGTTVEVHAALGSMFRLQCADSLEGPWQSVAELRGSTVSPVEMRDATPAAERHRFYRIAPH